jgi:hypothetical protein
VQVFDHGKEGQLLYFKERFLSSDVSDKRGAFYTRGLVPR